MSTRPCHLELELWMIFQRIISLWPVFKRFIARRGWPQSIRSGNGTNFVGANNELRKCIVLNYCGHKKTKWKFQLPSAPHFERTWEGLGKCKKKTLKAILKHRTVFKVVLRTALVETEGILNSRPIIQVSNDAEDIEELTPRHFFVVGGESDL